MDEQSRLRSLARFARALNRAEALPRLLEVAADETLRTLPAASVSLSRADAPAGTVRTLLNVGDLGPDELRWPESETYPMPDLPEADDLDEEFRFIVWRWALGDPDTPDPEQRLLSRLGKACSVSTPIVVDGRMWGKLYATRTSADPQFDDEDVAYLEALVAILSGALSRSDRERSLSELAYRDPLTGLRNRRALDEHADHVFSSRPVPRREVSVVAVDINGLKQTNDRLGHAAGDRLIQLVAQRLQRAFAVMPESLVARVGGDEFTVLVADWPLAEVVSVADRLCAESWALDPATALSCGAAGVVLEAHHGCTPAELFAAADGALYVAKRQRRHRTVVAERTEGRPDGAGGPGTLGG
jgi:diguanylate cyclase (GGDEF)-like protein